MNTVRVLDVTTTNRAIKEVLGHHCISVTVDNPTNQYLYLEGAGQYVVPYTFNFTVRDSGGLLAQAAVQSPPGINQAIPIAGQQAVIKWTDELLPPTSGTQIAIASVQIAPTDVTDRVARLLGQITNLPIPPNVVALAFSQTLVAGGGSATILAAAPAGKTNRIWFLEFDCDVVQAGANPSVIIYNTNAASPIARKSTQSGAGVAVPISMYGYQVGGPPNTIGVQNNSGGTITVGGTLVYDQV